MRCGWTRIGVLLMLLVLMAGCVSIGSRDVLRELREDTFVELRVYKSRSFDEGKGVVVFEDPSVTAALISTLSQDRFDWPESMSISVPLAVGLVASDGGEQRLYYHELRWAPCASGEATPPQRFYQTVDQKLASLVKRVLIERVSPGVWSRDELAKKLLLLLEERRITVEPEEADLGSRQAP